MASYLVVKNGDNRESFKCNTTHTTPTYLRVSDSYINLATDAQTGIKLNVKVNGQIYHPKCSYTTTSEEEKTLGYSGVSSQESVSAYSGVSTRESTSGYSGYSSSDSTYGLSGYTGETTGYTGYSVVNSNVYTGYLTAGNIVANTYCTYCMLLMAGTDGNGYVCPEVGYNGSFAWAYTYRNYAGYIATVKTSPSRDVIIGATLISSQTPSFYYVVTNGSTCPIYSYKCTENNTYYYDGAGNAMFETTGTVYYSIIKSNAQTSTADATVSNGFIATDTVKRATQVKKLSSSTAIGNLQSVTALVKNVLTSYSTDNVYTSRISSGTKLITSVPYLTSSLTTNGLSSITDLTKESNYYETSTEIGNMSSVTNLTRESYFNTSSSEVGNMSSVTILLTVTTVTITSE